MKRRRLMVLAFFLIGITLALLFAASRQPSYTATARVLVGPTPVGTIDPTRLVAPNLDREIEVLTSDAVARAVDRRLDLGLRPAELREGLEARFLPGSEVIRVSYSHTDPGTALLLANAFAAAYVDRRVSEREEYYASRLQGLQDQVVQIDESLGTVAAALVEIDSQRAALLAQPETAAVQEQLSALSAQRQTLQSDQAAALAQRRSLEAARSNLEASLRSEAPPATTIQLAVRPTSAAMMGTTTLAVLGGIVGLGLGFVAAFLSVRLDRRVTNERDVETSLETQVIGSIPNLGWRFRQSSAPLAMLATQRTPNVQRGREAYRRLRTAVQFIHRSEQHKAFLFTSATPGEGKSVTAANLAVALAAVDVSVALVSADLRRPTLERLFGVDNTYGLSTFLTGQEEELRLVPVSDFENLYLVPAGPETPIAGELLGSASFKNVVDSLKEFVDVVLIDTPPILSTADSAAAAPAVDGVIVVVDGHFTDTAELARVRANLDRAGARIIGAVLNRDPSQKVRRFGRRRRYSYER